MKKSPETLAKIVELAATGLPFTRCAEAVGVSISTLHRWKDEDATFATALEQSRALFIQSQHDKVVGSHDVADSRWLLERLDRDNYGRADAVQIEVQFCTVKCRPERGRAFVKFFAHAGVLCPLTGI